MRINKLAATFGRLEKETLSLSPGLNVIQAPNEGGKSTWTAFLRIMFYGMNTRDRSPTADKRRYMPWSGSAMEGRMDISTNNENLTILRRTQRANSPMGAFSTLYTDTTTPAERYTAANCGEALLGVPQDIYERSAYIRQSGIPLDQTSSLEKRIAALIATGEEDTSYTDAADRLRKQLNRRQSNRVTGLIPQLEQDLYQLRSQLSDLSRLQNEVTEASTQVRILSAQQAELKQLLAQHDAADLSDQAEEVRTIHTAYYCAQDQVDAMTKLAEHIPTRRDLESIRGTIDALESMGQAIAAARTDETAAHHRAEALQEKLASHPLAGRTPQEAASLPLPQDPRPSLSLLHLLLPVISSAALTGGVWYGTQNWLTAIGAGLGLAGVLLLLLSLPIRRRQAQWDEQQTRLKDARQNELTHYAALYHEATEATTAARTAAATRESLENNWQNELTQILLRIDAFCPAQDLPTARVAVEDALHRRDFLDLALRDAETAKLRWEMTDNKNLVDYPPAPADRPAQSRIHLQETLAANQSRLEQLHQYIHTAQGRIQAVGDADQLQKELELKLQRRDALQAEYEAIELAQQVLGHANTTLQNRFSPALGEKSAEIFTKLTRGRYNKVLLNREMSPSAQEIGQLIPHEAAFLSQGTADQLYLAVRLAICQIVLPQEEAAPILLDDALVTFDDDRMTAALDYLVELARERQILLFTCQSRELQYLSQAHPSKYHAIHL